MEYSIEIEGLNKKYDSFKLNDVNLRVKQGTIMGFIGENGAGKSTTLKTMMNITRRDSGKINILDMNIDDAEKEVKSRIGVVLDECHYHDTFSARSINTFMKGVYKNWDKKLFYTYLDKFSLPEKKVVKEYSRGMKMKLCIAIALSHNPELLILDEATSGLDPVVRNEILDVFLDYIQDENHSIIMSSHITTDIERVCDYVTFISHGNIIFSDNKDEVLEKYCVMHCSEEIFARLDKQLISGYHTGKFGYEVLLNDYNRTREMFPDAVTDKASLEDIMLYYGKQKKLHE